MRYPTLFLLVALSAIPALAQQDIKRRVVDLRTEDGQSLWALLYTNGSEHPSTGVVIMHPRSDSRRDWRLPYFAKAGIAGLGMASRHENSSENERYEEILLDLAAGVRYLRKDVGVKKVILVGHSGGGSLMTYYANQSAKKPGKRFGSTYSGIGPDLNRFDLPPVDLLIVSSSHFGNAYTLVRKIDPSVTNEDDPTSLNPALDMYNPENGFRTPPQRSQYSKEFLDRFDEGQKERVMRLTRKAEAVLREKHFYRQLMSVPGFEKLDPSERSEIERRAMANRYMTIYRLWAIPEFTDLSLDSNDRVVGSNRSNRPDLDNYATDSHPTVITVEAFLDTYSPHSHVDLLKQLREVTIPTQFICGTADLQEYPSERRGMLDASAARHKELVWIEGANHPYLPHGPKAGDGKQRDRAAEKMLAFINKYLNDQAGRAAN